MTSTNDGKDVKSNQTSGPKGNLFYIELYKTLDLQAGLSENSKLSERIQKLCEAWRRIYALCARYATSKHPHLSSWLQRHTERTILQTEWAKSKDGHRNLEEAIDAFIRESQSKPDGDPPWHSQLVARGEWFKQILANPWGHPVLRILLDPDSGESPSDEEVLGWLKEERGEMFATRLRQLASSKHCQDLALRLASSIMNRVRACMGTSKDDQPDESKEIMDTKGELTFEAILKLKAEFTADIMEFIVDLEFVLLHKLNQSRCIDLAKQIPLRNGHPLIERLRTRLDKSPQEKKLWKNAKDVARLIAQVVITRCMVVPVCSGQSRITLYCCTDALVRIVAAPDLPAEVGGLAAPAATARHLHTLAVAVNLRSTSDMKPFVCELYVRAITAGMNELEKLKLTPAKEPEVRLYEPMLSQWFLQLGVVLSASERIRCECTLTAFSVHPTPNMYEYIKSAPALLPVLLDVEPKEIHSTSEFGSWASDSRSQTNFVKTSQTLKLKHTQNQANVLSTAILNEGEALGLNLVLCHDIAVLLSGPRLKTLSWDMNRELLLENCRTYMERTDFGTRTLTTELKYLNLDPREYQHLPEEEEDESEYYGIEKGYEHLIESQQLEEISEEVADPERTESAHTTDMESDIFSIKTKKKSNKFYVSSENEEPFVTIVDVKREEKKKERPHSKERRKERKIKRKTKLKDPLDITNDVLGDNNDQVVYGTGDISIEKKNEENTVHKNNQIFERVKDMGIAISGTKEGHTLGRKKETKIKDKKKERKRKDNCLSGPTKVSSLSNLIGMKVTNMEYPCTVMPRTDYDSRVNLSNSEAGESNVIFDGLYSMDELKSPEKESIKLMVTKNNETLDTIQTVSISHPDADKSHRICKRSSNFTNNGTPQKNLTITSENDKNSITKLIQFRRQKSLSKSPEQKSNLSQFDFRSYTHIRPQIGQLLTSHQYQPPVRKYQPEKFTELSYGVNRSLNNTERPIHYSQNQKHSIMNTVAASGTTLQNTIPERSQKPIINNELKVSRQSTGNSKDTSYTDRKTVIHGHQKNYLDFVKELQKSINAGASQNNGSSSVKREIKPISRVTPIIPNLESESNSMTSAKLHIIKKEPAPETFSRLNYYKTNLLTNDNKSKQFAEQQSQKLQRQASTANLEQKIANPKVVKKAAINSTGNCAIQTPESSYIRQTLPNPPKNMTRGNTASHNSSGFHSDVNTSLIKIQNNHYDCGHKERTRDSSTTSLTERDHQDLLLLLRQQSKQNLTRPTHPVTKERVPSLLTNTNRTLPTSNIRKTVNNSVLNQKSAKVTNNPAFHKEMSRIPSKPFMVKTELSQCKNQDSTCNRIQKVEVIDNEGRSIKSGIQRKHEKNNQNDWRSAMDALLKLKTPSRAPKVPDKALRNDIAIDTFEKNHRDQMVVKVQSGHKTQHIKSTTKESNGVLNEVITKSIIKHKKSLLRRSNTDIDIKHAKPNIPESVSKHKETDFKSAVDVHGVKANSYKVNEAFSDQTQMRRIAPLTLQHLENKQIFNPLELQQTIERNLGNSKDVTLLKSEIHKNIVSVNKPKSNLSTSKKSIIEFKRQQYSSPLSKQDDPFISGIPNSDHDLLEALIDDDLRQEIGELSSDEDSYTAAISCAKGHKTFDIANINTAKNEKQTNLAPVLNSACKSTVKESQQTFLDSELGRNSFNATVAGHPFTGCTSSRVVSNCVDYSIPQDIPKNTKINNVASTAPTYVAVPQQTSSQNVVLIGSDILYQPLVSSIQAPIVARPPEPAFVAINRQPNIAVYHAIHAQFDAPPERPVITDNNITTSATPVHAALSVKNSTPINSKKCGLDTSFYIEPLRNEILHNNINGAARELCISKDHQLHEDVIKEKTDIHSIKNIERKVLSEVQEKQKLSSNESIEAHIDKCARDLELEVQNAANQERIKKKRKAILNRNIYHRSDDMPIALGYSPLREKSPEMYQVVAKYDNFTTIDKASNCDSENEKIYKLVSLSNIKIQDSIPDNINSENCKENKEELKTCHISLRSSNRLKSPKISKMSKIEVAPKKLKIRAKKVTCTVQSAISSTPSKNKKIIKRQRPKKIRETIETEKIEKRITRQSLKNDNKDNVGTGNKNEFIINTEEKEAVSSKPMLEGIGVIMPEFFDVEDELVGSMIMKTASPSVSSDTVNENPSTTAVAAIVAKEVNENIVTSEIAAIIASDDNTSINLVTSNHENILSTTIENKATSIPIQPPVVLSPNSVQSEIHQSLLSLAKDDLQNTKNAIFMYDHPLQSAQTFAIPTQEALHLTYVNSNNSLSDSSDICSKETVKGNALTSLTECNAATESIAVQQTTTDHNNSKPLDKGNDIAVENIKDPSILEREIDKRKMLSKSFTENNKISDTASLLSESLQPTYTPRTQQSVKSIAFQDVIKKNKPDIICLDNDKDVINEISKVKKKEQLFLKAPQSNLDDIIIEDIPNGDTDPSKKCVRIKLPNGRVFKATVRGQDVNIDSLFSDPALKSVFMKNLSNKSRYTLNIKQLSVLSKSKPDISETRIQKISVCVPKPNKSNIIETINLLSSDEEDENDDNIEDQTVNTEFGKYKIPLMERNLFESHQKYFNKKCIVKLNRGTLLLPDVEMHSAPKIEGLSLISSTIKLNSDQNANLSEVDATLPDTIITEHPSTYSTTVPNAMDNTTELITSLSHVICEAKCRINDSSNENSNLSVNIGGQTSDKICEDKIKALKDQLLKDLGIVDEGIAEIPTSVLSDEKRLENVSLTDISTNNVTSMLTSDVVNENETPLTDKVSKSLVGDVNCSVMLTKCDDLVENYRHLKSCVINLIRCDEFIQPNAVKLPEAPLVQMNFEANSSSDMYNRYPEEHLTAQPVSSSGSFSISNNFNSLHDNTFDNLRQCSSPVMEAYESFASMYKNTEMIRQKHIQLICVTEWCTTKSQINIQCKYDINADYYRNIKKTEETTIVTTGAFDVHDFVTVGFMKNESSPVKTCNYCVPNLISITTKLLQDISFINKIIPTTEFICTSKKYKNAHSKGTLRFPKDSAHPNDKTGILEESVVSIPNNPENYDEAPFSATKHLTNVDLKNVDFFKLETCNYHVPKLITIITKLLQDSSFANKLKHLSNMRVSSDIIKNKHICSDRDLRLSVPKMRTNNETVVSESMECNINRDYVRSIFNDTQAQVATSIYNSKIPLNPNATCLSNLETCKQYVPKQISIITKLLQDSSILSKLNSMYSVTPTPDSSPFCNRKRKLLDNVEEVDKILRNSKSVRLQQNYNYVLNPGYKDRVPIMPAIKAPGVREYYTTTDTELKSEPRRKLCIGAISQVPERGQLKEMITAPTNGETVALNNNTANEIVILEKSMISKHINTKDIQPFADIYPQNKGDKINKSRLINKRKHSKVRKITKAGTFKSQKKNTDMQTCAFSEKLQSPNYDEKSAVCKHIEILDMTPKPKIIPMKKSFFECCQESPKVTSKDTNGVQAIDSSNDKTLFSKNFKTNHVQKMVQCETLVNASLMRKSNNVIISSKTLIAQEPNVIASISDSNYNNIPVQVTGDTTEKDTLNDVIIEVPIDIGMSNTTGNYNNITSENNTSLDAILPSLNTTQVSRNCEDILQNIEKELEKMIGTIDQNTEKCIVSNTGQQNSITNFKHRVNQEENIVGSQKDYVNRVKKISDEMIVDTVLQKDLIKVGVISENSYLETVPSNDYKNVASLQQHQIADTSDCNNSSNDLFQILSGEDIQKTLIDDSAINNNDSETAKVSNKHILIQNQGIDRTCDESSILVAAKRTAIDNRENAAAKKILEKKYRDDGTEPSGVNMSISNRSHSQNGTCSTALGICNNDLLGVRDTVFVNQNINSSNIRHDVNTDQLLNENLAEVVSNDDKNQDRHNNIIEILNAQSISVELIAKSDNKNLGSLCQNEPMLDDDGSTTYSLTVGESGVLLHNVPNNTVEDIVEICDDELEQELARIVLGGHNNEDEDKQILIINGDNLEFDELKICCIQQSELQKIMTIDSQGGNTKVGEVKFKKSLLETSDSIEENDTFNHSYEDVLQITQEMDEYGDVKEIEIRLNKPRATYSRKFLESCLNKRNLFGDKRNKSLKRKCDMTDLRTREKKYRKGKNIDTTRLTADALAANSYRREFSRLFDYYSSIKFSYSRSLLREYIDVDKVLRSWPINSNPDIELDTQLEEHLFMDTNIATRNLHDPLKQTLAEEIAADYSETDYSALEVAETNFQMGFGEESGRVIQNSEDNINLKFSAATLSDVKQKPLLLSESYIFHNNFQDTKNELEKVERSYKCFHLKNKVRSFFYKTMNELSKGWMKQTNKDRDIFFTEDDKCCPFGLTLPDFIEPSLSALCVQVVQLGQLPVSASAQNPMTCDPRVTQVSNASPSQCSVENGPNDDPQSTIKTEYTELTTADIRLPLHDYAQHHNQLPVVPQDTDRLLLTDVIIENIKEEIKEEVKEEPEVNEIHDYRIPCNESYRIENNGFVENMVYRYETNTTPLTQTEISERNTETFKSKEKTSEFQSFSHQQPQRDRQELLVPLNQQLQFPQQNQRTQQNLELRDQRQHQQTQQIQQTHLQPQTHLSQQNQQSPIQQQSQQAQHLQQVQQIHHQHHSQRVQGHLQVQLQNEHVQLPQQNQHPNVPPNNNQNQQSSILEKSDQIAHAMNAAGITTAPETLNSSRTHALVNIISQKLRQGAAGATPSTNSYPKTTQINAMALQQALAQILPPPLSHSNAQTENNQQNCTNTSQIIPQVLHIVQGKNASGNQITLVDNTQSSTNNTQSSTSVLHIVQSKNNTSGPTSNGTTTAQSNSFSGLSLVESGLQQGNQLLHIVNTGNQKNTNTAQLLRKVNLLTNLTNVQGNNEQKMLQFVCKSADGKAIQLNAPNQRGMVLRLQPVESPALQQIQTKSTESQDVSPTASSNNMTPNKENSQQEIKSRSVYEENYAKFIQSSNKTILPEKATSLPKFGQAFGKQVFQEGSQKNELNNSNCLLQSSSENTECQPNDNAIGLEHVNEMNSPPLLLRKSPQASQAQANLVQQLKQTIGPMSMGMHGGVIYTRQIPVNIGGGQTINLITVPSTDLVDDSGTKHQQVVGNQEGIEPSIIKLVPQNNSSNSESCEENNSHISNDNLHTPQPQPVLTQMRIKLPMLSKAPQMIGGARLVRPSFFQIQRNVIGGANQPVYQQLVLTAAPPLGQSTIRLPQAQTNKQVKVTSESPSESQMSTSTLEQLREFDLVLEQVKERSTGTVTSLPSTAPSTNSFPRQATASKDTTDSATPVSSAPTQKTQQVLYAVGNTPPLSVTYVNKKTSLQPTIPTLTPTSSFTRSPDSSEVVESPTSSTHQATRTVTSTTSVSNPNTSNTTNINNVVTQPKSAKPKPKPRPKAASNPPNTLKLPPAPPKTSTQKPAEDEQTTQRILYILAEYKEQVENSPDKNKPAPRRRTNLPTNPGCSSKRKKCSSGSRRSGRDMSPCHGEDTCRTMGSEDSSCGTSQGDCNESCLDSHSPQDSPRKVVRKLTFENETTTPIMQPRPQPQRNVIVADGQTITVARGTAGKPTTAVLMPANYILPVSMVKGGQQIAIVTNRGPKLLTVGGSEGGTTNALLLQRLIGPAGLKPVLTRPGVRHVRLPTAALHNLQAFNLATTTAVHTPDSTASSAPLPNPPDLIDTRAASSPWRADRESHSMKPERSSSPESSEPWHLPPSDYCYEETVRAENIDRTVLDPIPDRYSPDMEAQRIFDKMFDVDSKKSYMVDSHDDSPRCGYDIDASDCDDKTYHQVVHKKDGSSHRQHRLTHVSAAALRHKYAILEHELRLQKSLSEECEDLGVDSPSASELFPEAELLFAASPAHDHAQDQNHHSHTPQPILHHSGIPQPDIDDQIATDQLIRTDHIHDDRDLGLGLEDVGIVTVSEDGMQATIQLDQEEFARSHPNTTFHSEPTEEGEIQQSFTLSGLKSRHITSTIFHGNRQPGTVLMSTPQTTVISQAIADNSGAHQNTIKYSDIDNMINSIPGTHNNNINLSSVLVKEDGISRFDGLLDSRELHLSNTASTIVHSSGHTTQVIRRVCYEDDKPERDHRYLMDESEGLIAGDDAKMMAEDSSRDATFESMGDTTGSSPERNAEMFWESNSASGRADFSSDSEKCCKSPSDDTSTDSSAGVGVSAHMRLDSVIKEARGMPSDDDVPPLRTYPAPRSLSGKTAPSAEDVTGRRRASGRGVVKRGTCLCCVSESAPPRPKKPRQRRPAVDFAAAN